MYLGWYDPDKKKSVDQKLTDAIARYVKKWGEPPVLALVNESQVVERDDITVQVGRFVPVNTFYVGLAEE